MTTSAVRLVGAARQLGLTQHLRPKSVHIVSSDMGLFFNGKCSSDARLDGKTAIVTGSNTGIGKVTAEEFAKRGARVIMACRNLQKAEEAAEDIRKSVGEAEGRREVLVIRLDLSSLESVRECAAELIRTEPQIHLLINNAGIMFCPWELTVDGYEMHFATNHLGHFLFTLLLLPTILASAPARIVNVSSKAHVLANSMIFEDVNLTKKYSPMSAYGRSKLANILFSKELAKRLQGTGVTVYSLHPGVVDTDLGRHLDSAFIPGIRWLYKNVGWIFQKSVVQGAQTTLYCALDEKAGNETGLYYEALPSRICPIVFSAISRSQLYISPVLLSCHFVRALLNYPEHQQTSRLSQPGSFGECGPQLAREIPNNMHQAPSLIVKMDSTIFALMNRKADDIQYDARGKVETLRTVPEQQNPFHATSEAVETQQILSTASKMGY